MTSSFFTITRSVLPLLLAVLLGFGCASAQQASEQNEPRTTVRVENRSFFDVTIYVLRGEQRFRLGQVALGSTEVFTIPASIVRNNRSLRFLADPVGTVRTPVTEELNIIPGDEVTLMIPP